MAHTVYDNIRALGRGEYSTTFRGSMNGSEVAVKRARGHEGERRAEIEAEHLRNLSHDNIVKFLKASYNSIGTLDIVLELAEGGTLAEELRGGEVRTDGWKRSTIRQLADGLAHIHGEGIQHLDLKPKNILFRDSRRQHVLIADFGMATKEVSVSLAGARIYCAHDAPAYTKANDVHCLAMIACCITENEDSDDYHDLRRIRNTALHSDFLRKDSSRLETVERAFSKSASLRPSAAEFRDAFIVSFHDAFNELTPLGKGMCVVGAGIALAGLFAARVSDERKREEREARERADRERHGFQ